MALPTITAKFKASLNKYVNTCRQPVLSMNYLAGGELCSKCKHIPNIQKFQCWKEEKREGGGEKEEGGAVEGKVSYSVSGDLQIT